MYLIIYKTYNGKFSDFLPLLKGGGPQTQEKPCNKPCKETAKNILGKKLIFIQEYATI